MEVRDYLRGGELPRRCKSSEVGTLPFLLPIKKEAWVDWPARTLSSQIDKGSEGEESESIATTPTFYSAIHPTTTDAKFIRAKPRQRDRPHRRRDPTQIYSYVPPCTPHPCAANEHQIVNQTRATPKRR